MNKVCIMQETLSIKSKVKPTVKYTKILSSEVNMVEALSTA